MARWSDDSGWAVCRLFDIDHLGLVIPDTHGKTSQLSAIDVEALSMYLKSLQK